jgi:hypothetical protein
VKRNEIFVDWKTHVLSQMQQVTVKATVTCVLYSKQVRLASQSHIVSRHSWGIQSGQS